MSSEYSRLPPDIRPSHYKLRLEPNFETFKFNGDVEITVDLSGNGEISEIAINANKLVIDSLTVKRSNVTSKDLSNESDDSDGETEPKRAKRTGESDETAWSLVGTRCENVVSSFNFLEQEEVILIKLPEPVTRSGSPLLISILYTGELDDTMRGFYRTQHNVAGNKRWGAACHFEATGARKCFPCFDQPEFRSTYDISVVRPDPGMEVISNMGVKEEVGETVTFRTSPPLPSYLVCVVIGWYSSLSQRTGSGVPITVFTPRGDTSHGEFALDVAVKAVEYFQEFFSTPYTLPKMDLVAVPDFYIGAMENWGLLTFRETALLFDPKVATTSAKQYVAILVCHEVAHQWFGNLVGIEWWDQLWLKEGFASWISFLAVDKIFPEFNIWSQFLTTEKFVALNLDSKLSSHPIEIPDGVNSPAQIDEIFDEISYSKGASVIHMLYHWLGGEKFAAGLQSYLHQHKGSCASNGKLWKALEENCSNVEINRVMTNWVTVQGYPLVHVSISGNMIHLKQEQFGNSPNNIWGIPLSIQVGKSWEDKYLLDTESGEVNCSGAENNDFVLVNKDQTSYCRVSYSEELLMRLCNNLAFLSDRDRVGLLADCGALLSTNQIGLKLYVEVIRKYEGQTDFPVVQQLCWECDALGTLWEGRGNWAAYLDLWYKVLGPSLESLGFVPLPSDTEDDKLARSLLITRLGRLGHTETVGRCWMLWHQERAGKLELDKDIQRAVYTTVARVCKWEVTEQLITMYRDTESAETMRVLRCLASNTDTEVAVRVLDWMMGKDVKLQDKTFILAGVASTGRAGRELAWRFFQDNSRHFLSIFTSGRLLINLVTAAMGQGTANTDEEADMFEKWFRENKVEGVDRTVQQVIEEIRQVSALREKLFPS